MSPGHQKPEIVQNAFIGFAGVCHIKWHNKSQTWWSKRKMDFLNDTCMHRLGVFHGKTYGFAHLSKVIAELVFNVKALRKYLCSVFSAYHAH